MKKLFFTSFVFLFVQILISAQIWEPTPAPPDFVTDHSFGFSISGKGYLVAGTTEFDGPSNEFFQFDPVTDSWAILDTFPGAARGYGIGDIWNGKAYFGFGVSTTEMLNDLWVFDADSMKWMELDTCPCEPRLHPAMVALNGKIFVGLGNNSNGNLNDWWEYDIDSGQWSQKPSFPGSIRHHPYQFAADDYVYTGFGHGDGIFNDWYQYDPVNEAWLRVADIPSEGRVAGTQFSHAGNGYVLSGDGDDHSSMETGEFWSYDPILDIWSQLPPHPGKSRWAPASFLIDGVVYLFNGTAFFEGQGYVYQTEAYKFDLDALISSDKNVDEQIDLTIYPNPANNEIGWQGNTNALDDKFWRITDSNGIVLKSGLLNWDNSNQKIDVGEFPSGLYFLIMNNSVEQIIIAK